MNINDLVFSQLNSNASVTLEHYTAVLCENELLLDGVGLSNTVARLGGALYTATYALMPAIVTGGLTGTVGLLATMNPAVAALLASIAFSGSVYSGGIVGGNIAGNLEAKITGNDKKLIKYFKDNKDTIKDTLIKASNDKAVPENVKDIIKSHASKSNKHTNSQSSG
jgi:DNA-binding protein YbaB